MLKKVFLKHEILILYQIRILRNLQNNILNFLKFLILLSSLQISHETYNLNSLLRLISLKHMSSLLRMQNYDWKTSITSLWLCLWSLLRLWTINFQIFKLWILLIRIFLRLQSLMSFILLWMMNMILWVIRDLDESKQFQRCFWKCEREIQQQNWQWQTEFRMYDLSVLMNNNATIILISSL